MCWLRRHDLESTYQLIPRVLNGVQFRAFCRQTEMSSISLCAQWHSQDGKALSQTVATKLDACNCLKCFSMLLYPRLY